MLIVKTAFYLTRDIPKVKSLPYLISHAHIWIYFFLPPLSYDFPPPTEKKIEHCITFAF